MIRAGSGLSLHPDSRTAGEEAALAALLACEDARDLLVFASHHHAATFGAVMAGVESLAANAYATGCTGYGVATEAGVVVGVPAVAVLAIAGDGLLIRPGQRPRGPADPILLAREMGAPRGMQVYVLCPGPEAGDPLAIIAAMSAGLPTVAVGLTGTWETPATAIGSNEVEPGGTLAWLLAGACEVAVGVGPAFEVTSERPPAFGLYLGAAGAGEAGSPRFPAYPVAGLVGSHVLAPGGAHANGVLLAVSPE